MEKKRNWVIDALVKLGCAQADSMTVDSVEKSGSGECIQNVFQPVTLQGVDETFIEVQKFADLTDTKVLLDVVTQCQVSLWSVFS